MAESKGHSGETCFLDPCITRVNRQHFSLLTHFIPLTIPPFHFSHYTPRNRERSSVFLMISGGAEKDRGMKWLNEGKYFGASFAVASFKVSSHFVVKYSSRLSKSGKKCKVCHY